MKYRVAVVTEIPTPYRDPIFSVLSKSDEFQFDFFFLSRTQKDRKWDVGNFELPHAHYMKGSQICFEGYHTIHFTQSIHRELIQPRFDAYVLGGYAQPALFKILRHCWKTRTPYIPLTESHHGKPRPGFIRKLKDRYVGRVYQRSASNLVMSSKALEYVVSYGAKRESTFLFPNTVDGPSYVRNVESLRQRREDLKRELQCPFSKILLFVGTLNDRKGVDPLIEAFADITRTKKNVGLVLVGDGPDKALLESKIKSRGIESQVRMVGFVDPKELPKFYAISDLFLLPSIEEPFGAVICEAMASALPVITTTAVGAAADFVEKGRNGDIVSPGSSAELSRAIREVLSQEEKLKEMGRCSKEIMLKCSHVELAERLVKAVRIALKKDQTS